jgi:peptide chain release factor 3
VCSGTFERNTPYLHVRQNKKLRFSNPTAFMAAKKSIIDEAFPGDIVGLYDAGNFKIGDSLTEGEKLEFKGIPSFSPEQFRIVHNSDPLKSKQLAKGLEQLMEEGVAQMFSREMDGTKIIGTVGALQFEVLQHRLKHEYGASCSYEPVHVNKACWVTCDDDKMLKEFRERRRRDMALDKDDNPVFLAETAWVLRTVQEAFPKMKFHFTSERN